LAREVVLIERSPQGGTGERSKSKGPGASEASGPNGSGPGGLDEGPPTGGHASGRSRRAQERAKRAARTEAAAGGYPRIRRAAVTVRMTPSARGQASPPRAAL